MEVRLREQIEQLNQDIAAQNRTIRLLKKMHKHYRADAVRWEMKYRNLNEAHQKLVVAKLRQAMTPEQTNQITLLNQEKLLLMEEVKNLEKTVQELTENWKADKMELETLAELNRKLEEYNLMLEDQNASQYQEIQRQKNLIQSMKNYFNPPGSLEPEKENPELTQEEILELLKNVPENPENL